jgi:hypothetical protein
VFEERRGDMLGHRRLQVDTRKWYLSKVLPKKFGDKSELDLTSGSKPIVGFNFIKNGANNTDNTANAYPIRRPPRLIPPAVRIPSGSNNRS